MTAIMAATRLPEEIRSADAQIRDGMPHTLLMTLLTGIPHTGQRRPRLTPGTHLLTAVTSTGTGLALSCMALTFGGWMLLLLMPGWAMTLHGARNLRMMIYHQCAHRNMWNRRFPDAAAGKIVAALLMVQNFGRYKAEHVAEHHALHHMTLRDPTVQAFLVGLGLHPGMSRQQMWREVTRKLISPVFHAQFAMARLRSYFRPAGWLERATTSGAYAVAIGALSWFGYWPFLLIAWVVPMTVFFQISNTLRLCVKHTFPRREVTGGRGKDYFASLTNSVFFGEPVPAPTLRGARRALAWCRWWTRIAVVHFPGRYLVLTGDTVCHDYHHRHPMSRDWPNYIFARQEDVDTGHRGWPPYRSVWGGLIPAVNAVFDSLAAADPDYYSMTSLASISRRETFASFDD